MYISISEKSNQKYPTQFKKVEVKNWNHIADLVVNHVWSPIIWTLGVRKGALFDFSDFAVLDVDDGLSLKEAYKFLNENNISHVLFTTKSHQIAKNDEPARDRFRIIIPWERRIKHPEEYSYNIKLLAKSYEADCAATDLARIFQPGKKIISIRTGRKQAVKTEKVIHYVTKQILNTYRNRNRFRFDQNKIRFFAKDFLDHGRLDSSGGRKRTIYSVACELAKCGYSESETTQMILNAPINWSGLSHSVARQSIASAYRRFRG
jgi:hypothetical protein